MSISLRFDLLNELSEAEWYIDGLAQGRSDSIAFTLN